MSYVGFSIQIWALAVSPETEKLATGGGDSVVNMWTDCTIDDEEEAIRQEVKPMISSHCCLWFGLNYCASLPIFNMFHSVSLHVHVCTTLFHSQTITYSSHC